MNKIWGIGLPRTGTTSLAEAIGQLGFKTSHYCVLQSGESSLPNILDEATTHDAVVNNHLHNFYHLIYELESIDNKIGLYILTYRLDKQVAENLKYMASVYSFFRKRNKTSHLLLLDNNAQADVKWKQLSGFLGMEVPKHSFPHLNKGLGI